MMNRYEILMLGVPQITEDETRSIEQQLETHIKNAGGSILTFDRWGKYKLAYPVKKNDYGIYFLTRFEVPKNPAVFEDIRSMFAVKYSELIVRHVVVKLQENQNLEYKRPQSVEDMPARDGEFSREKRSEKFDDGLDSIEHDMSPVEDESEGEA